MSEKILIVDDEKGVVDIINAGQVFDRERIYEVVWGIDGDGNSDTVMEHIRKIRSLFAGNGYTSMLDCKNEYH